MQSFTRPLLISALLALMVLAGCPTLKLTKVMAKPGSVSATGFTLSAEVVVEETDDTEGEGQKRQSGKGLLGVQVPAGWTVTAARIRSPKETTDRALFASPQGAAAFAEAFPNTGGVWWGFASPNQEIAKGVWTYALEVDVVVPKKTKAGDVSLSASILSEDLSELTAPMQYGVTWKGKTLVLAERRPLSGVKAAPEAAPADSAKAPAGG